MAQASPAAWWRLIQTRFLPPEAGLASAHPLLPREGIRRLPRRHSPHSLDPIHVELLLV